jgi:hypothetical protein
MTGTAVRVLPAAAGLSLLLWGALSTAPQSADAQPQIAADVRYAGLQWTFARIRYKAANVAAASGCIAQDDCWMIDYPAAEQNLSRRVRTVTSIQVNEPVVITLDDPAVWTYPWLYIVEPGTMQLSDADVATLREFLLRGGTLTFDDFHGLVEWAKVERDLQRMFPDRKIVELQPEHPIFSCFYQFDRYPQTPGLGSFLQGRSWEKGGYVGTLRAIEDDSGRAMVLINFNTDMGDGWEWSNAVEYPGYVKYTAQAYRMQINEIIYSLTH